MSRTVDEVLARMDLFDEAQRPALIDALAAARSRCPVVHTEADGGYYVVTRYDDLRTVCEDPDTFSSTQPGLRGVPVRLPPLDADLPVQQDFRKLLGRYFSRSFLLRYEEEMRTIARDAIAAFIDRGEVELVSELAVPFSAGSLARIVFCTDDQDLLQRGVEGVHRIATEGTPETFFHVAGLALEALAEARADPRERDDVLAALVTAEVGGRPMTDEERLGVVTVLFLGGLDTTKGMIANIAYHLATRADVEDRLRSPDWWRSDLDEFIRFEPTVAFMARTCTRDVELGGTHLKAGDRLALSFFSANRDAARFERPDELDFDREPTAHAGFGLGIHRCLGLNFARIQIAVVFEELLAQATGFRLSGGPVPRQMGATFHAPLELRLAFDRR